MNGWHRLIYRDGKLNTVVLVEDDMFGNDLVSNWQRVGYTFEPVVVLTVEEHAALVRDAEMARNLKRVSMGLVRAED